MIRYFSLFTGVGGFELGIKKALGDKAICVGFSEIDKFCNKVLEVKFPNIKNYGDATKIDATQLPDFDLLVAGFPCQAFSIAGKRKGFDDTRGTLFFEIARICSDKKPKYLLLENVKGLLSHDNGRTFQTIIRILADLGYFVEWQVLNSKDFGAPQNRERVFIIGYFGEKPKQTVFPLEEGNKKNKEKRILAHTINSSDWRGANRNQKQTLIEITKKTPKGYRVYNVKGISTTIASQAGGVGAKTGLYIVNKKIRRLTPLECQRLQGFPDDFYDGIEMSDTQKYKQMGNAVTVNVVEYIVKKMFLC